MNNTTELNSELLSEDARSRKHIPVAVFAVILIHVVLFVLLLIAAGCRSTARAKATQPQIQGEPRVHPTQQYMQASAHAPESPGGVSLPPIDPAAEARAAAARETVVATEPVMRTDSVATGGATGSGQPVPEAAAVSIGSANLRETAGPGSSDRHQRNPHDRAQPTIYVVQSGDTVGKIAREYGTTIEAVKSANKLKNHLIYPGQKLLIKPPSSAGSTAQLKSRKSSKRDA